MQKHLLTLLFCLTQFTGFSQSYLNTRQSLGYLATIYTGIYPTDSCLFIKGVYTDSSYIDGTFFAKSDFSGEILWKKEYADSLHDYSSWFPEIVRNKNGNFVFAGYHFDFNTSPSDKACFILEYNGTGELVRSNSFKSPYDSAGMDFIAPISIQTASDGGYLICGNLDDYGIDEAFVAKLNDTLGLVWIKTVGGLWRDSGMSVAEGPDGTVYVGGNQTSGYIGQNLVNRHVITAVDSSGQEEYWRWEYPENSIPQGGSMVRDMLVLPDGSIICGSGVTKEEYVNDEDNFVVNHPAMFKLNADRELVWLNKMGNGYYYFANPDIVRIVFANDGGGYVGSGYHAVGFYSADSLIFYGGQLGFIEKVSEAGDSVWLRALYLQVDETNPYLPTHEIYDMKPSADYSGYWLCGQSAVIVPNQPPQQGWLLFVDNYGCMVPGCQGVSSSTDVSVADKILVYPNPASETTMIYHGGYAFSKGVFRIVGADGQLLREWLAPLNDLTTSIELGQYQSGIYFLQYLENGEVRAAKQLVVTKP